MAKQNMKKMAEDRAAWEKWMARKKAQASPKPTTTP
jgi:hypothetical protein